MKKLFVLLGVFCALCFVACSNFQLAGGDMGVVSLSIGDNLAREIRSAAASRNVADGTYTLTASIRGEYSDSQTVAVANGNYSGVTFTFEDVPVGKRIILDLTAKADGNYIWYGNSGKHTVEQGENLLTIALGRVSGVLLWKSTENGGKIAPYGNLNSGPSSKLSPNLPPPPFWCFDNTGNLYWSAKGRTTAWCYNLQSDESYTSGDSYSYSSSLSLSALSYDNVASILYGITGNGITKLTTSSSDQIIKFDGNGIIPIGFAVHNGIAYVAAEIGEGKNGSPVISVKSFNLNADANLIADTEFTLPSLFGNNAPITSQMIYQDGALYLLLSSFTVSSAINASATAVYSCGALVKINPSTLAIDTSFGDNGYLGLVSGRTISGTYNNDSYSMKLYSPTESDESRAFYGPVGFVAVMPKKLVIADAGYALSKGSNNELRARRKNRVVTVDLETQAFDVASLSDTTFYGNITSGCGFLVVE